MKAVICTDFGPPESLQIGELPEPAPAQDEGLVEVHAAGVNYSDFLMAAGKHQTRPQRPFAPGIELAGTVVTAGESWSGVAAGDKVMATCQYGAFAERIVLKRRSVRKIPDSMDLVTAAGFSMAYGTAFHALKQRASLATEETLLVLGAGSGVGLATVNVGNAMGATVIAAARGPKKLAAAEAAGAHHLLDLEQVSLREEVRNITGGRGADVIFDPIGDRFDEIMRCIAWNGRILVAGFMGGKTPSIPANLVLLKGCQIVGVFYGSFAAREPDENESNFDELFHLHATDKIAPRVSNTYPMTEIATPLAALVERSVIGKVVIRIPR